MDNSVIFRIGRILYGLMVAFFGVNHFLNGTGLQNTVPSFFPGGLFWVYLTGGLLLLAAIAFLTDRQTRLAGLLMAAFLLIIVLTVHLPAVIHAPDLSSVRFPLTNLVKDTGLAAAALMIAGHKAPYVMPATAS
ncbi:MAG TPA: DoxX family membrane protein [Puia sp.]|nr:DoxX family membrane protein [Puia sp.]